MTRPHEYPGTLVVLEGLPGAGKTTLAAQLAAAHARSLPADTVFTAEPFGRKRVRERLDAGDDPYTVFTSDRADHVEELIKPALERGALVITDRYAWSTAALQSTSDVEARAVLIHQSCIFPRPDLWIFLDTPPEECVSRVFNRRDFGWEQYRGRLDEFVLWRRRYGICVATSAERTPSSRVQTITGAGDALDLALKAIQEVSL